MKKRFWILFTIGVILVLIFLCLPFISCIYNWADVFFNGIENYYTIVIALGGVIGGIGVIYNLIYSRKRIDLQEQQLANQDKQLRNEQFTAAATQLGHESESVRLGGIYSLYALAEEYPKEYLNNVCDIFCAHIRTTTRKPQYQIDYKEEPSTEIQTIIDFLFKGEVHIFNDYHKNLSKSCFNRVSFASRLIKNVDFSDAKFISTNFMNSDIEHCEFGHHLPGNTYISGSILWLKRPACIDIDTIETMRNTIHNTDKYTLSSLSDRYRDLLTMNIENFEIEKRKEKKKKQQLKK